MYFPNYELQKKSLDKCLKSRVSDHPWKGNMFNGPKQLCNLDDSTFTIFIDHFERN